MYVFMCTLKYIQYLVYAFILCIFIWLVCLVVDICKI